MTVKKRIKKTRLCRRLVAVVLECVKCRHNHLVIKFDPATLSCTLQLWKSAIKDLQLNRSL